MKFVMFKAERQVKCTWNDALVKTPLRKRASLDVSLHLSVSQ